MSSLANINIRFSADLSDFSKKMTNSLRTIDKFGQKMQSVGSALTVGVTAPILAFGVASVLAFDQSAQAIAQVDAALKSTGATVGYNSQQLQKMAADLQGISTFDDDEILKKATANLLTFSKITGTTFQDAQKAALDLATRLDGDLQSASIQVGKALNDPIKGVAALSKVGVSFSVGQKAMIKSMVETNNLAGAQAIILKELQKEFGGSAEAAAKAGSGPLKQLGNQIGDLSEEFGKIILDAMKPFIGWVKGIVTSLQELSPATKTTIAVIAGLAAVMGPLALGLSAIAAVVPLVIAGFTAISAAIVPIVAGIVLLMGAFIILKNATKETASAQSDLNKAIEAGNKNAVQEVTALDKLYAAATNVKNSTKQRKEAVDQLQALYPAYFKNIDAETIKNGKAEVSYNQLRNAIFNKSRAAAIDNQLQLNANERITKEIELQDKLAVARKKLDNVQKNGKDQNISLGTGTGETYFSSKAQQVKAAALALKNIKTELADFTASALKSDESLLNAKQIYDAKSAKLSENEIARIKSEEQAMTDASKVTEKAKGEKIFDNGTIAFYEQQIALLKTQQSEVIKTGAEYYLLGNKIAEVQEKINQISLDKIEPLDLSSIVPKQSEIKIGGGFPAMVDEMQAKANGYQAVADNIKATSLDLSETVSIAVESLAENAAVGFGEAIGGVIAGTQSLGSLFSGMLGLVANFMKDLGKQLVAIGIARIAFDKLKFSGIGAVAAGIALIALSTVVQSKFSEAPKQAFANGGIVGGASFYGDKILARVNSGELILNNKQQKAVFNSMNSNTSNVSTIIPDIRIQGSDLLVVFERAQNRKNRIS